MHMNITSIKFNKIIDIILRIIIVDCKCDSAARRRHELAAITTDVNNNSKHGISPITI
jgi:hypothetical protein